MTFIVKHANLQAQAVGGDHPAAQAEASDPQPMRPSEAQEPAQEPHAPEQAEASAPVPPEAEGQQAEEVRFYGYQNFSTTVIFHRCSKLCAYQGQHNVKGTALFHHLPCTMHEQYARQASPNIRRFKQPLHSL